MHIRFFSLYLQHKTIIYYIMPLKYYKSIFVILMCFYIGCNAAFAQKTYLYKRVMVVKNGIKSAKNDDAHFITINSKGCYESDRDGYTKNTGFANFTKNEKNLHCYYGNCYYGNAHYYFSSNYDRINIVLNDNLVYVYQREMSGRTTASMRKTRKKTDNPGRIDGTIVVIPDNPTPTIIDEPERPKRQSLYSKCNYCNGTGVCQRCHGKCGEWTYIGSYTGSDAKTWINCSSCNGNGRCSICRGSGRL